MHDLLTEPKMFENHLQRYTASIASTVIYGWRTPTAGNTHITDLLEVEREPSHIHVDEYPPSGSADHEIWTVDGHDIKCYQPSAG